MKTPWGVSDMPSLQGKTVVITGTGGLGFECAKAMVTKGATVILAGRNRAKGDEAVQRIQRITPGANIRFEVLDLASQASIHAFADRMRSQLQRIDILLNNAAVMALPERKETEDGFEMQFGTNHLGHFALTLQLLPLLRGSRVTTVSSTANKFGKMQWDDLQSKKKYSPMTGAYGQAKLANILFAAELQRRADAAGFPLTSNSAHPGYALTDLIPNGPGTKGLNYLFTRYVLQPLLSQSASEGALPELYAATAPEAKGFEYYGPSKRFEMRGPVTHAKIVKRAQSEDDARRLWEISEQATGTHASFA